MALWPSGSVKVPLTTAPTVQVKPVGVAPPTVHAWLLMFVKPMTLSNFTESPLAKLLAAVTVTAVQLEERAPETTLTVSESSSAVAHTDWSVV